MFVPTGCPKNYFWHQQTLDGFHEPPVVMTKEMVRESHSLALLMPQVVFRTPSRYKLLANAFIDWACIERLNTKLYNSFCTMIFFIFHENNIVLDRNEINTYLAVLHHIRSSSCGRRCISHLFLKLAAMRDFLLLEWHLYV